MKKRVRGILLATALVVALALAALGTIAWIDSSLADLDEPRIAERVQTAKAVAAGVTVWFAGGKSDAEVMARNLEPWSGSPSQSAAARSILDSLIAASALFDDGAFVVSPQSRVVATTTPKVPLLQLSRESPHATAALRGAISASGIVEDLHNQIPVVAFAAPLHDQAGRVTGALVASTRVAGPVSSMIKSYQSDSAPQGASGARVLLVAPDGAAIAPDTPEPLQRDLVDAQAPAVQARADSEPGFFEYKGESGVAKAASYAKASDGWVVVMPQDASEFFEFGSGLAGRLTSATPIRTAAIAILIILTLSGAAMALLWRRLQRAEARAEEAKRAFLAVTGHELRTPLTSIRGFSQMLTSRWDGIPDSDRKELIQTIARQARSLEHLVERLIVAGQLEAGLAPSATMRSVDAAAAIGQAAEQFRGMSKIHSFEVDVEEPLKAEADTKMLQEVLGHLLENAIKYSPAGGPIRISGRRDGGRVVVTVEDEGVGLPSDISGIFEKFIQGEAVDTRTHDEGGVGVGLFIVKTYLERMHGKVRAERRQPSGARFEITLKAARN